MREFKVAGTEATRADGIAKVTGAARYTVDLTVPGTAHAVMLRSTRAHARITRIERDAAERRPGVLKVIVGDDLVAAGFTPYYGHVVLDHPVLAIGKVRYHGEPVALVVAETKLAAAEAADLVEVTYEDLPAVIDADEALRADAPILHEQRGQRVGDEGMDQGEGELVGNVCAVARVEWGDIDAAFAKAHLIVEGEYRYPMLYGYAMEPYNALALFDQGDLVVYSSAQHVYMVRRDLARMFGLPLGRVRVSAPYVGGGYGTKSYTKIEGACAMGAYFTGRPVKLELSVEEAMLTTRSDSSHVRARTAFDKDGRILGREYDIVMNSGAYTDNSPLVNAKTANRCFGPYKIPALRVVSRSVFTNTVPGSSLRGFGAPQGNFSGELMMDEGAEKLGIDPIELRLRNLVGPGEVLIPGKRPLDADLKDDLRCLATSLGWPGSGAATIGLAVSASDAGAYPTSTAAVRIHSDDSVTLFTGSTELGQGSRTVLSQIVAEELGLPLESVGIVGGDTGVVTYERTTGASRTTTVTGRAVQEACRDARARVRALAADVFKVDVAAVQDTAAGVRVEGRELSYGEVIERWFGAGGEVLGHGAVRKADGFAQMPPFWEIGCSGVALTVDRETGVVRIEKLVTVGDVGFAINPALVHGQDLGAAMMGLGAALREELVYEGDQLANANVVDYRVPRFSDQPREIDLILAERRDGAGPFGAKGAGEGAGNAMGSAVSSAIARAIGVFPHELPASPERVWRLLRDRDPRARR
ncbi:MAG TPA: xanthine dehydrogenase family protein molybdopterin-binding subunit [Candidatus Limnocylindria bacterium]|nr:xanthine dehydrogenase family protein molybdopterin-binding subunit [Candidatus Limnocylindria bacterium]